MSSAQLDIQPLDEAAAESEAASAPFALKQQVAERLAAHRARHGQQAAAPAPSPSIVRPSSAKPRAAQIAAAVAERYAQSQSYRAFLAAEAERAIQEAQAAAEVAARSAQAIADAQNELLAELDQWELTPPPAPATPPATPDSFAPPGLSSFREAGGSASSSEPQTQVSSVGLTVRLYEDSNHSIPEPFNGPLRPSYQHFAEIEEDERLALEDEIAFRQSPTFEDPVAPVEIPANLIEFPRQLVAPRRARPRIAEGPLREEAEQQAHDATQLRIFEVEPTQISTAPAAESAESIIPEWSSILLNAQPVSSYVEPETLSALFSPVLPLHAAPPSLRLMAALVDGCILLGAFLSFAVVFVLTLARLPAPAVTAHIPLQIAAIGSVGALALMGLLYQGLFFTFSEATPGMRYARIGLCTFNDENPTRAAMRRRILAAVLAACPLGLGFLWAWLDDDSLGWHDRISRIYQRSY